MTEKEIMQEGLDFKLYILLLLKKIWMILAAGALAAVLGAGVSYIGNTLLAPEPEYEAASKYYLTFAYDNEGDVYDHYNAYTWNDLAASDLILDYTLSLLPEGYDREYVKQAVTCTMPSDYRVIHTSVVTENPDKSMQIAKATEQSLIHFGEIMPEFSEIKVIEPAEVAKKPHEVYTVRTGMISGGFAMVAAFFILLFYLALDTSVYLPAAIEKKYGLAVLGAFFSDGSADREMTQNLGTLLHSAQKLLCMETAEKEEIEKLALDEKGLEFAGAVEELEDFQPLRGETGIVIAVRYGAGNGNLLRKQLALLEKQNCEVSGIILYHADQKLLSAYYGTALKSIKRNKGS